MKKLYLIAIAALFTACGSDLESLKNDVCACKGDMQCLAKLEPKMQQLKEKMGDRKPTAEEEKIGKEMVACMMSGMGEALGK